MADVTVHSFYRSNIAPQMVAAQAAVFEHLGIPLKQWLDDDLKHCNWIDQILRDESDGDLAVIADIDAFPLTRTAFDLFVQSAEGGAVTGMAQVANHLDPTRIYAGPMFMAVSRTLYQKLGGPSACETATADVAQSLSDAAVRDGVPVNLIYPRFAIQPKWALTDRGVFGVGTFYGDNEFFHLFQSRHASSVALFCAVAEGVVAGRHDFDLYLAIMDQAERVKKKKRFGLF